MKKEYWAAIWIKQGREAIEDVAEALSEEETAHARVLSQAQIWHVQESAQKADWARARFTEVGKNQKSRAL